MLFYHRAHAGRRRRPAGTCPVGGLPSGKLGFWAKFPAYRSMSEPSSPRPDLRALFLGFSAVGLSGFGGVLPFARRMLVEQRRWMSAEEFNAQLGLCQFLPGPNVINLAVVVGKRYQGVAGAIVAPLGMLAGPFLIVMLLAML